MGGAQNVHSQWWFVVLCREGVRIVHRVPTDTDGIRLEVVADIGNAEGRLRPRDLESSRHGSMTGEQGTGNNAYSSNTDPTDVSFERFVDEVCVWLGDRAGEFEKLVIVAEPGTLGVVRKRIPSELKRALKGEIPKDLYHTPFPDLVKHLDPADVVSIH